MNLPNILEELLKILLVLVLINQNLEFLNILRFFGLFPPQEICIFANELLNKVFGAFSFTLSPLVENWLEKTFVKLSHRSENSSSIEKIKLFVILLIFFAGFIWWGQLLAVGIWTWVLKCICIELWELDWTWTEGVNIHMVVVMLRIWFLFL